MADEDNVLFIRGSSSNKKTVSTDMEDVWDDTALIKAYDKAVNLAKEEVAKRMGVEAQCSSHGKHNKYQNHKQNRHTSKPYKKWVIGSPCRAIYSEDGEIYEAVIQKILDNIGMCVVQFVGYGNVEKVELHSLLESDGLESQTAQQRDAMLDKKNQSGMESGESTSASNVKKVNGVDKMECDSGEESKLPKTGFGVGPPFSSVLGMMPPAPPLPPQLMTRLPEDDADALSSMLMSWYISGFHTGYYHGLKQAKDNQERRKK